MNVRCIAPIAIVFALVSVGCDSGEEYDDADVETRDGGGFAEFWNWFPNRAGNGDLEIHRGETTDIEECLIFDIGGAGLSVRSSGSADNPDEFELVAEVDDSAIVDADDGTVLCSAQLGHFPGTFELEDSGGTVLYTLVGDFVLDGGLDVPPVTGGWPDILQERLVFHIEGEQVFDGFAWDSGSEVLVTADARIDRANPMRQLVIAALVDGSCGSPGYDSYPAP